MRLENGDLEWVIDNTHPPQRIDHYMKARLPRLSRASLQAYIREGKVRRLERSGELLTLKVSSRVQPGDVLRIERPPVPPPDPGSLPREALRVLYEDADILVVDKPAGMLVHPAGVRVDNTLIGILRERYAQVELDLAHRLDRETSGLVILARHLEANRRLKLAFKQRHIDKTYLGIAEGCPDWEERRVDLAMGDSQGDVRIRQAVREDGAPASTVFRVIERLGPSHVLLEANPETGRLHQIRVHLEAIGHRLVGDKIYGGDGQSFLDFREEGLTPELLQRLGHWRHALHAATLRLNHPMTRLPMVFEAPLPPDLLELAGRLRAGKPPWEDESPLA